MAEDQKLILRENGDVDFDDPEAFEHAMSLLAPPSYYDRHCAPKGKDCCSNCKEIACPVTN